ncbi:MAG: hypothetical protein IJA48_04410 [Oscillospiraceae bacterium]|nr:hypothetical protein [Oscillospiraceae bacterium]
MSEQVLDHRSAKEKERLLGMNLDELNALLLQVSELPEFAQKDAYIQGILEVMQQKSENPYGLTREDILAEREDFWESYCELRSEAEADIVPESPPISTSSPEKPKKKPMIRFLRGIAAAAVVAALFCGIVGAFGSNVLHVVMRLGKGSVVFAPAEKPQGEPHAFEDLYNILSLYSELPLVPKENPMDATASSVCTGKDIYGFYIDATYLCEKGTVGFSYHFYETADQMPRAECQVNEGELQLYKADGTSFYIFQNLGQTSIVWFVENVSCFIWGDFSVEEAKQMVDSLY